MEEHRRALTALFVRLQRQVEAWNAASVEGGTHFVELNSALPTLQLLLPQGGREVRLSAAIEAAFPDLRDKLLNQHRVLLEERLTAVRQSLYSLTTCTLLFFLLVFHFHNI